VASPPPRQWLVSIASIETRRIRRPPGSSSSPAIQLTLRFDLACSDAQRRRGGAGGRPQLVRRRGAQLSRWRCSRPGRVCARQRPSRLGVRAFGRASRNTRSGSGALGGRPGCLDEDVTRRGRALISARPATGVAQSVCLGDGWVQPEIADAMSRSSGARLRRGHFQHLRCRRDLPRPSARGHDQRSRPDRSRDARLPGLTCPPSGSRSPRTRASPRRGSRFR
jgi:hypothetical protein